MIDEFKYIGNVGRFASHQGSSATALKKVSLVHSENGRGKTTLCAVLRSLGRGEPAGILERRRVPGEGVPRVTVRSNGADISFTGTDWNAKGPVVLVFDEHFVDTNVYSGLAVAPGHRQNLHGLVIGQTGVAFAQKVDELAARISDLKEKLKEHELSLTPDVPKSLSAIDFCKLPQLDGLEQKLVTAKDAVRVLRDAEKVRTTDGFNPIGLPLLPQPAIEVLNATLPDVEAEALAAVGKHFDQLGDGAEDWASKGIRYIAPGDPCPFCKQTTSASAIVDQYRTYFSEAYAAHKSSIADASTALSQALGGDALAQFQRALQAARDRHTFWSGFIPLPPLDIDSDELQQTWIAARNALSAALRDKAGAPLEVVALSEKALQAIDAYNTLARSVNEASLSLLEQSIKLDLAKEKAQHGNLAEEQKHLETLQATQQRYTKSCIDVCDAYLATTKEIKTTERKKKDARDELAEHRAQAFRKYETAVNTLLRKFNADFRLEDFGFQDGRGGLSSQYQIGVNKGTIPLAPKGYGTEPSFRTALSAGDRTTLALALFFVQLQDRSDLSDAVVVFDDPISSLDDHRTFATTDEIAHLVGQVEQLIVFSHSDKLLSKLWGRAAAENVATLAICNAGANASRIEAWDAHAASIDDYDRRFDLVKQFAVSGVGDSEKVAPALRKVLERFVRVAFNEHCPPGTLLGPFLNRVKTAANNGSPILSENRARELEDLKSYANQFHHDTNTSWQESITNVNKTQLQGFAERVIEFTRLAGGVQS